MSTVCSRGSQLSVRSIGVDWITATTKTLENTERLLEFGSRRITDQMREGNERRWWAMSGFQGHACGHVQVGFRDEEAIVRLGSSFAAEHWRELYQLCDNVSRFDLQVTSWSSLEPGRRVRRDWTKAKRESKKRLKGPEVTVISKMRGGDTFYTGSPTSQKYGRCYDKAAQSKLPEFKGCVRHETQFNGKLALLVARNVYNDTSELLSIARHLSGFWRARLGAFPVLTSLPLTLCVSRQSSDLRRKLAWLETAVRPSIQSMIARGMSDEVLQALGLSITADLNLVVRARTAPDEKETDRWHLENGAWS